MSSIPGEGSTFRVELTLPVVERRTQIAELEGKRVAIDVSRAGDAAVFREHAVALGMELASLEASSPPDIAVVDDAAGADKLPPGVSAIRYGRNEGGLSGPPI